MTPTSDQPFCSFFIDAFTLGLVRAFGAAEARRLAMSHRRMAVHATAPRSGLAIHSAHQLVHQVAVAGEAVRLQDRGVSSA